VIESFFTRLEQRATDAHSLLCVGLDPHPGLLEEPGPQGALAFCRRIIDHTVDYAAAFKPNTAFFEALGPAGMAALEDVVASVPEGIPVLLDAKRGDIASSAEAYATAVFDVIGADAVTASPYLGREALEPLISRADRGVFVLARTSNPGAADLQDARMASGETLAERVVELFGDGVGFVVGATAPGALRRLRRIAPEAWILAPGVGPQGADLEAAVTSGTRRDGLGLLLSASRAIATASDPSAAAEALRDQINRIRDRGPSRSPNDLDRLAADLHASGCIRFGAFTLKSGVTSPVYIDLRRLCHVPDLLSDVARLMGRLLQGLTYDHIAALPYAALPIGTAIALQTGASLIYPRREAKEYGTRAAVEGVFATGERAVVIDDVATTGASKIEAIRRLADAGIRVDDVVVLIDRRGGAAETLEGAGYRFHAMATLEDLIERIAAQELIDDRVHRAVMDYLSG
jgi:uridine monophosphate synthetase